MFCVATWNVNSIRSRLMHLLGWLREEKPDIVLIQELKCTEDAFPAMEIEELGYNIAIFGEKSYNGVAILSKFPLSDIYKGLPGDVNDTHARYIEALVNFPGGVARVASVYVPNGQEAASDKFSYKLRFLDRLYSHVKNLLEYQEILIIGGDYNIAPEDIDAHDPKAWEGSVLTHDKVRCAFRRITNLGVYDACRLKQSAIDTQYSWWDYRANAFAANNGLRIDHLLLSPQAADIMDKYHVNIDLRGMEKASDHTPVIASFKLPGMG